MEVDVRTRADNSDFDASDVPPLATNKKRGTNTTSNRGEKTTTGAGRGKKAAAAKAPTAKKATGRAMGKKTVVEESDESAEVIDVSEEEEEEVVQVKNTKRTNRAAVLRFVSILEFFLYVRPMWMLITFFGVNHSQPAKKAPAKRKTTASSNSRMQGQLNFQPVGAASGSRSTRAAATKARGRIVVNRPCFSF